MENKTFEITTKTLLIFGATVLGLIFGLWVIFLIWDVILYLFIALILTLALEPFVELLTRKRVPRMVSVLIVVGLFLVSILSLASLAIVPFVYETQALIRTFPTYLEHTFQIPSFQNYMAEYSDQFVSQLSQTTGSVFNATVAAFSGVIAIVTILVFLIYLLIDFRGIRKMFFKLFPEEIRGEIQDVITVIETKLGDWLRGQLTLMVLIGVVTYIGLVIIGVPYPVALAVLAGLFEIVPFIGPTIAAIPAVIIAFAVSPLMGLATLIFYILVQQAENAIIVPKIMQKAVGFNPLVTIIVLMVGGEILGIIGVIISVPISIIVVEIFKYLVKKS